MQTNQKNSDNANIVFGVIKVVVVTNLEYRDQFKMVLPMCQMEERSHFCNHSTLFT